MVGLLGPLLTTALLVVSTVKDRPGQELYAVLPFKTIGIDRRLGTIVTHTVRGTFVKNHRHVLRKDVQQELLAMQGYGEVECTERICGIVLGRTLNVDFVVVGAILLRGKEIYLHASVVDVEKGVEKSAAQSVLDFSTEVMPFSQKAEQIGYALMGKPVPGWTKRDYLVFSVLTTGAVGYGIYYFTQPRYGTVDLIAVFPVGDEP